MRTQLWAAAIIGAALTVGLIGEPTAHADEAGFLNELRAAGFPGLTFAGQQMPDGAVVAQGYMACNRFHLGERPDQLLTQVNPADLENSRMIVRAAQHQLCPDTL